MSGRPRCGWGTDSGGTAPDLHRVPASRDGGSLGPCGPAWFRGSLRSHLSHRLWWVSIRPLVPRGLLDQRWCGGVGDERLPRRDDRLSGASGPTTGRVRRPRPRGARCPGRPRRTPGARGRRGQGGVGIVGVGDGRQLVDVPRRVVPVAADLLEGSGARPVRRAAASWSGTTGPQWVEPTRSWTSSAESATRPRSQVRGTRSPRPSSRTRRKRPGSSGEGRRGADALVELLRDGAEVGTAAGQARSAARRGRCGPARGPGAGAGRWRGWPRRPRPDMAVDERERAELEVGALGQVRPARRRTPRRRRAAPAAWCGRGGRRGRGGVRALRRRPGQGRKTPGQRSPRVRSVTGAILAWGRGRRYARSFLAGYSNDDLGGRCKVDAARVVAPLRVGTRNPVPVRGGSATVRACVQARSQILADADPIRGARTPRRIRAHRTAVHVETDLLSARESGADYVLADPARPGAPVDGRGDRGLRPRRRPAARLAAGPVLRLHARRRDRDARRRARRRAIAERRADGAVVGSDRRRGRGAPLPRRGRAGEPPPAPRLPLRHGAADGEGVRAAAGAGAMGVSIRSFVLGATRPAMEEGATRPAIRVGVLYYRAHEASAPPSRTPSPTRSTRRATRSAYPSSRGPCARRPTSCTTPSARWTR